jgi:hypothetical protein
MKRTLLAESWGYITDDKVMTWIAFTDRKVS